MRQPRIAALAVVSLSLLVAACGQPPAPAAPGELVGRWRAVLTSPGGELPFTLEIAERDGRLEAWAENGDERAPFSAVALDRRRVELQIDWYDAEIVAELDAGGDALTGRWRKTAAGGDSSLPFAAVRGDARRFLPLAEAGLEPGAEGAPASVAGSWRIELRDDDGSEPARGELEQDGARVTGTFLTPTGDYRYLEGSYERGVLRLSTFDGAHAFLFRARAAADGTLSGDFWSRDSYHASWTARPVAAGAEVLPDAWQLVGLENDEGRFDFRFPDLDGEPVALSDERFRGKVVLVNVFGSWCPNCNDKAPLLARWHQRWGERGLQIVGLAYELSGDPERDRRQVARFAERHGIDYPLLLAGVSDKAKAAETLPDLTAVVAFPTTVFVGRDGKVRRIHTGFAGPGTGEHHSRLVAELESLIETLLAEPA